MSSFQTRRDLFDLPEGITYLDGNSLGPLPKSAVERARTTMAEEWGRC
jgi:kynureninase